MGLEISAECPEARPPTRQECERRRGQPEEIGRLRGELSRLEPQLRRLSDHYALLGSATRIKILALLEGSGELCVCDLASVLGMTPAAVSQHLSRLRSGGLVRARRDGMTIYYRRTELAGSPPATTGLGVGEGR